MDRESWLQRPWALLMNDQGRKILAWEVGEEAVIWSTACVAKALEAGQSLALEQPILAGEVGGWSYEQFKAKGCEHCKQYRRHAVVLGLHSTGMDHWCIKDGSGKTLKGLKDYDPGLVPIRLPKEWMQMEQKQAKAIIQALREGLVRPIFR